MDIQTLQDLGITPEELSNRIVDQTVDALLRSNGFDPETEREICYESKFRKEISSKIQECVDKKIASLAAQHFLPRVSELIESADMRKTNTFGEPKSDPMSFKEYLAYRAENYMTEDVDHNGNSKADLLAKNQSTYDWKASGPRLVVLMKLHIKTSLENEAKKALTDVNKAIAKNIEQVAKEAISSAANAIKINVFTK